MKAQLQIDARSSGTLLVRVINRVIKRRLATTSHGYADDSQLYISFSPKAHSGKAHAVASIEHCSRHQAVDVSRQVDYE